jgi:hypothetical protein
MIIHANEQLSHTLRSYLQEDRDLLEASCAIIHLGRMHQGEFNHEDDLRCAHDYLSQGVPVLLLGRSPRHDYERYPLWQTLRVDQEGGARFLSLDHKTGLELAPILRVLLRM